MKTSKKPILELEPYVNYSQWEDFLYNLGLLIQKRFNTGYVQCKAENIGWQRRSGYKVFECDINEDPISVSRGFLCSFMPDCDWCARVYSLNSGKGLYFSVSHHDAHGESYYLTPISERTYERLS